MQGAIYSYLLCLGILLGMLGTTVGQSNHPSLLFSAEAVSEIRAQLSDAPLFAQELQAREKAVMQRMGIVMDVPSPKDMAGGYTHEQHKRNWKLIKDAGLLYQLTGKEAYAAHVRKLLMAYAAIYPTLPLHPSDKSYSPGKLFWQCLNDANWLVYAIQGYDCVYPFLDDTTRTHLETRLFLPMAEFLSTENPQFFNRIHNHSTWACAAVGMTGVVLGNEKLIERALYGLPVEGDAAARDNDGGFIISPLGHDKAGFLAQMDGAFSPDGFFAEGPYYLRYALYPYLLFAQAVDKAKPELGVATYRDTILKKAAYVLLHQTDGQGNVFPLNDAQKGMSWFAGSMVGTVNMTAAMYGISPMLKAVAQAQQVVPLDQAGFEMARSLAQSTDVQLDRGSQVYRDGPDGHLGGISILRGPDPVCAVFKYSSHGGGHGHFDRLSYSFYDETGEVVQDYGAARWVNIDQKGGGRYLPENKTWAKQTLAHNTLVVDQQSHFRGKVKKADASGSRAYFHDFSQPGIQISSAKDTAAYPGVILHRTLALIEDSLLYSPVLLDIFVATSSQAHRYDLPFWYQGQLLQTSFEYVANIPAAMGKKAGYEHLYQEAKGVAGEELTRFSFLKDRQFYTLTSATASTDTLILGRLGADDPQFNLRRDPVLLTRKASGKDALFVNLVERHGSYNPASEVPYQPFSQIDNVKVLHQDTEHLVVEIRHQSGRAWTLALALTDADPAARYTLQVEGQHIEWTGPFKFITTP